MITLGRTDPSSQVISGLNKVWLYRQELSQVSYTVGARAYLDGQQSGSGNQPFRIVVYNDLDGQPNQLITNSGNFNIPDNAPPQWFDFPMERIRMPAGAYWIGIQSGYPVSARIRYEERQGQVSVTGIDAFSTGSEPVFVGATSTEQRQYSIYIELDPVPALPQESGTPPIHPWAEEIYRALLPLAYADAQLGWHLRHYLGSIGTTLSEIADLVYDNPNGPGWSEIVDVERIVDKGLPWLAQLVGVRLWNGMTPEIQRSFIDDMAAMRRGTREAMIKTIKMTLMGTKFVRLEERASCPPPNDPAYHIRILVYNREMPNEFATRSAILAQKPAGLTYELTQMAKQTWRTLRDGPPHARTWQTVKDDYASWRLAREDEPVYEETAPEDLLYPGDEVFPSTTTYPGEVGP